MPSTPMYPTTNGMSVPKSPKAPAHSMRSKRLRAGAGAGIARSSRVMPSSGMPRPEHDHEHARDADGDADDIGHRRTHRIHRPQPEDRHRDVHAAIRRIDASRRMRV